MPSFDASEGEIEELMNGYMKNNPAENEMRRRWKIDSSVAIGIMPKDMVSKS